MIERLDYLIEDAVRKPVTPLWDEMKRDAHLPFDVSGNSKPNGLEAIQILAYTLRDTGIKLHLASIPYFPEVVEFSRQGLLPGGLHRNKDYYSNRVKFSNEVPEYIQNILYDAQTSGGLLICLSPEKAELLHNRLQQSGIADAALIGEAVREPRGMVVVG